MTTPAPPKQGAPQAKSAAPVAAPWPFPVGVLDTQNASDYDQTKTMSTGTVQFPDVQVQPDGWTRGIWFDVNAVATSNTNTVTFNSDVTTEIVMARMSPTGICRKNTCWNRTAQAIQASALIPAPITASRQMVGRDRRSLPCSPAMK